MKPDKTELKKRFLELRNNMGITQQEASELFGVALSTWQSWEWGVHSPNVPTVKLLEHYEQNTPKKLDISEICKLIRSELRITKLAMATLFKVDPGSWADWEAGNIKPNSQNAERIKQIFKEITEQREAQKAS